MKGGERDLAWKCSTIPNTPGPHTKQLVRLIKRLVKNPEIGCEVGVWKGGTSTCLLRKFPNLRLLMVDNYQEYEVKGNPWSVSTSSQEEMMQAMVTASRETLFAKDRRILMVGYSTQAAKLISDESLDFVFIDADHHYEHVLEDIRVWFPKVKPQGLISGHDYSMRKRNQVRKAVDAFIQEHPYEVNYTGLKAKIWWFIK